MAYYGTTPTWIGPDQSNYSHDFQNQIAQQQGNIDSATNTYNQWKGQAEGAKNTYNEKINNTTAYNDMWNQAKADNGVNEAKAQYLDSLNAVNATDAAMNTLPSSINANSNVTLTNAQRQAALGNQMTKYQNTMDYYTNQNATDQNMYNMSVDLAKTQTAGMYQQQRDEIADALNNYQQQMADLQNQYNNILQEREIMRSIYGDMYEDEYHHMMESLEVWADNLEAETQRYVADKDYAAKVYAADADLRLQQYLKSQQKPSFADYLASNAALDNTNWAEGMTDNDKYQYLGNMLARYQSGQDIQNILSGETYADYRRWLNS